jgi:4-carboxymuconolactone decarboxylase
MVAVLITAVSHASTPEGLTGARDQPARGDLSAVSPALADFQGRVLSGDLWRRPGLSRRDRSLITIAVLIARNQTVDMPDYFRLALDSGVTPAELSEVITHLAFYSGWENAASAAVAAKQVFQERHISEDQLPATTVKLLPLDEAAESRRATQVQQSAGGVAPGVVQYTTDVLFHNLWLRPGLVPRDRSLITVSALIANGQSGQVTYHLNRAMDAGLTQVQASEMLTQLAFYAGWPNVFSAIPVFKGVFESRAGKAP